MGDGGGWEAEGRLKRVSLIFGMVGMWNGMMEWIYITIQRLINVQTYMVGQQIALTKLS